MAKKITVFKGDGIGQEITDVVMDIVTASGAPVEYEVFQVGERAFATCGELIPRQAYESVDKNKILLKSPIATPIGKGFRSLNVTLRERYNLFANIRPAKSVTGVQTTFQDIDIVVFRENTEDLYIGMEEWIDKDTVIGVKLITRKASEKIIRAAFNYARDRGRKKVTCVHKANILKESDGLFLHIFQEISREYPDIEANDKIIDNACMQVVMNPWQFDVMVMPNFYGDLMSDLVSGLIGGLGLLPSSNLGEEYAMFEAVHGSAPDIAGKNIANPTALLWSACMLLDYIDEGDYGNRIRQAVDEVLQVKDCITPDLGGRGTTTGYRDEIIRRLK